VTVLSIVTRKDFLIGVAIGFFALPYVTKNARGLLDKVKGAAS
jgi:hypothetical protein